jgi:hypothetical protein
VCPKVPGAQPLQARNRSRFDIFYGIGGDLGPSPRKFGLSGTSKRTRLFKKFLNMDPGNRIPRIGSGE